MESLNVLAQKAGQLRLMASDVVNDAQLGEPYETLVRRIGKLHEEIAAFHAQVQHLADTVPQ